MSQLKDSTKTEWQSTIERLTCIFKSSRVLNEIKRDDLLSHLWSDQHIKNVIHLWLEKRNFEKESKSITKAQKFKAAGNKAFRAKDYSTSIKYYTNCISCAPTNSIDRPVGIANRSAALFYIGRYNECIKDIQSALISHYPKCFHHKVLLRAAQCYQRLGQEDLAERIFSKRRAIMNDCDYVSSTEEDWLKLIILPELIARKPKRMLNELLEAKCGITFQAKETFPHASITINREYNETSGWHVVANTFITKGDILFIEKPVSFVLLNQNPLDFLCQHCSCSTGDIPISCSACVHTFYCSITCLTEAMSAYHHWECLGSHMEIWKEIGIGHLALKVFLTCSSTTDKTKVNEMQRLITNFDKLPMDDIIVYGITAVMLTTYLLEYTDFFEKINLENCLMKEHLDKFLISNFNTSTDNVRQLYVSHLLLQYILQLIANGHAITKTDSAIPGDDSAMIEQDIVATGVYPSASTMNHSCDPNIINIFVNQYLIVRASRDIGNGEEIFNCYGPHYRYMPREERQQILENQYCFSCKCKHCIDPKLQYFLERFDAMKCPKCDGACCTIENSLVCIDCNNKSEIYFPATIVQAKQIFEAAQVSLASGETQEALNKLMECLHIRKKVLYLYNVDITETLNLMAEVYKQMGKWEASLECIVSTIPAIRFRFGVSSIELLKKWSDIADMHVCYLNTINTNSDRLARVQLARIAEHLDQVAEITSFICGSWSKHYKNLKFKQEGVRNILSHVLFAQTENENFLF